MKTEPTLVLKTKEGLAVRTNGHGRYSIGDVEDGFQVRYPETCIGERTRTRILEQASLQTGKACEWVPGERIEVIDL